MSSSDQFVEEAKRAFENRPQYAGSLVVFETPVEVSLALAFTAARAEQGVGTQGDIAFAQKPNLSACVIGTRDETLSQEIRGAVSALKTNLHSRLGR